MVPVSAGVVRVVDLEFHFQQRDADLPRYGWNMECHYDQVVPSARDRARGTDTHVAKRSS